MEQFEGYIQRLDRQDWRWPRGQTREVAEKTKESSPGPDGAGYSCWAHAPDSWHQALDDLAEQICAEGEVPDFVARTVTVFIPKVEVAVEAISVPCTPSSVRPITLMNVSAKLMALIVNKELARVAELTVAVPQNGFVNGRVIGDNILGMDGAMTAASLLGGRRPAGIFWILRTLSRVCHIDGCCGFSVVWDYLRRCCGSWRPCTGT